jgi:hypothetical protein
MPMPASGSWTTTPEVGNVLESTGMIQTIFRAFVESYIAKKLALIEKTGTLAPAERALRDGGSAVTDRAIEFIKINNTPGVNEWANRGFWMRPDEIGVAIDAQWTNILKRWS